MLERVPRVPGYPLRFDNRCGAPVLIRVKYYKTVKGADDLTNPLTSSNMSKESRKYIEFHTADNLYAKKDPASCVE